MITTVHGLVTHAATGGVAAEGHEPAVVLVHGAGMDATVWQLQTRYLAHRGLRTFAVDLPAHGRSDGGPLPTVDEMADWLVAFLDAVAVERAHVVGHSMGTFVALDLAARHPELVGSITLCGTATGMPVHPELLDAAEHDLPRAAALMAAWGHAKAAHAGVNPTPGLSMVGGARALVERSAPGVLAADFRACMAFDRAEITAAEVRCPATVVVGDSDKMTPAPGGRSIAATIPNGRLVELAGTGHQMMTEAPGAVRRAILDTVRSG